MGSFHEIMQRLKESIITIEKRTKILDKDVAKALGLTAQYFAVIKRREKIPYEAIALFCQRHRLSINWILLGQQPKYLTWKS